MSEITLYSSHCPHCIEIEEMLKSKKLGFKIIDDSTIYMQVARDNHILSMPFAEVNGKILGYKELYNYIMKG